MIGCKHEFETLDIVIDVPLPKVVRRCSLCGYEYLHSFTFDDLDKLLKMMEEEKTY